MCGRIVCRVEWHTKWISARCPDSISRKIHHVQPIMYCTVRIVIQIAIGPTTVVRRIYTAQLITCIAIYACIIPRLACCSQQSPYSICISSRTWYISCFRLADLDAPPPPRIHTSLRGQWDTTCITQKHNRAMTTIWPIRPSDAFIYSISARVRLCLSPRRPKWDAAFGLTHCSWITIRCQICVTCESWRCRWCNRMGTLNQSDCVYDAHQNRAGYQSTLTAT